MPTQAGRQSSRCGSITAQQGRLADALHLTALLLPSFTVPLEAEAVSRHLALHPPPLLPLDAPALGSAGPGGDDTALELFRQYSQRTRPTLSRGREDKPAVPPSARVHSPTDTTAGQPGAR